MTDTVLESPYPTGDAFVWLKGNFHAHTTRSDGEMDIRDVIRQYARLGHDFLQVSDHDVLSDYTGLDPTGLLLLDGLEISADGKHVLCLGMHELVEPGDRQAAIDRVVATGGLPVLCHPGGSQSFDDIPLAKLKTLQGYIGMEIFNGCAHWNYGTGYALDKWDLMLSAGRPVWGLANDDSHVLADVGRGWNVVRVRERTPSAILDAIRHGAFYASTGVTIETIECAGNTLHIVAPDAEAIAIQGMFAKRLAFVEASEITYRLEDTPSPYIRADCFGRGERRAWTQPIRVAVAGMKGTDDAKGPIGAG